MRDLPVWASLSLATALDEASFVREAARVGVSAAPTRDGLQLPGGFLARLDGPFPDRCLDRSLAAPDVALGPVTLHVSGGTNDTARDAHQQPTAMRKLAQEVAAKTAAAMGLPDSGVVESAASRKMTALARLLHGLCPLATAVILPKANNIVLDARAFAADAERYLEGGAYSFPLFSFLKVRDDEGVGTLVSTGMWPFGLPETGIALPQGADRGALVQALGELRREMVAEGWWPEDGSTFEATVGTLSLERVGSSVWVTLGGGAATGPFAVARARFARAEAARAILGDPTHHHRPAHGDKVAIEHYLRPGREHLAITNGISDRAQPGGTTADENDFVELSISSRRLGPWADGWLHWASKYLAGHDGSHPIKPFDRLVLPEPTAGIAGVITWPFGHLAPTRPGAPTVRLWDLVPFHVDELAMFRQRPGSQGAWLDERVARGDFEAMHARWDATLG